MLAMEYGQILLKILKKSLRPLLTFRAQCTILVAWAGSPRQKGEEMREVSIDIEHEGNQGCKYYECRIWLGITRPEDLFEDQTFSVGHDHAGVWDTKKAYISDRGGMKELNKIYVDGHKVCSVKDARNPKSKGYKILLEAINN